MARIQQLYSNIVWCQGGWKWNLRWNIDLFASSAHWRFLFKRCVERMLLKRGMGNRQSGIGNGKWEKVVSGNTWKIKLESAQYGKETRTARGKRKMEGKNIYLSVFPEFLELLSFCLLKLTTTIDLQVMRVTKMLRITSLSLPTGWYKKIRINLSTVASIVDIKTTNNSKSSLYFDVLAPNQLQRMILCLQLARMNLCLRYENVQHGLEI